MCSCPECGGAGFVRKSGGKLNANAARKDQAEIVCQTCKGLGKVGKSVFSSVSFVAVSGSSLQCQATPKDVGRIVHRLQ